MRRSDCAAVLASAVIGMIMTGCDLLDQEVLIDEDAYVTVVDSTTIRVLNYTADSTHVIINSTADWNATLTDGEGWCTISKTKGRKGTDTIHIFVQENSTTSKRKALIGVESGTLTKVFWVVQSAAEEWLDVLYWDRTPLQRAGMHGKVDTMRVTDNWHPYDMTEYVFDERGNLQWERIVKDNIRTALVTYEYDKDNHRLGCTVTDYNDNIVREWTYEYENTGKYVAYSAQGWMDENPLAEDMEGMVVPGLSAVHKTWTEGGTVFHHDRTYTFEQEYRLAIAVENWKDSLGVHVQLSTDTARVSYQYTSGKLLPQKVARGYVKNAFYYPNGMLYTYTTADGEYKFHQNPLKMVVESYNYTGDPAMPHEYAYYECDYNTNHDLVECRKRFSGTNETAIDLYPQYQYDSKFNWILRYEETSNHERYTRRSISYFKNDSNK